MFAASPMPEFSRRNLLQVGAISGLGLTLPGLLHRQQLQAVEPVTLGGRAKSCIFILQYGGPPHQDLWDLKPDAPEKIRGAYSPIETNVPGIRICEKMPRLAQQADKFSLIRSMTSPNGGHDGAMHICMTGKTAPTEKTPYFGSLVSKLLPAPSQLPPYVWIQNLAGDVLPWYLTGGTLGMAHSPLRVGNDLDNPSKPGYRFTAFDPPEGSTASRVAARHSLLGTLDARLPSGSSASSRLSEFGNFQEKAHELVSGSAARKAFDLDLERPEIRDRYGRHPLGQNLLMARRLVESGVRLVTVVAWTGLPEGEQFRNVQTWDMHGVVYKPHDSLYGQSAFGLGYALPRVDEAVSALLEDLDDRGLLDGTLVAMAGEFGRTAVNDRGRDHWPNCYSSLLAGGGIRGGMVYGASDQHAAYVKDNPVPPPDFGATVFEALGIPAETRYGPDDFSFRVSDGTPVQALFS